MNSKPILSFLKDLKKNNNKEWFHANNQRYQEIKLQLMAFTDELIKGISTFEPEVSVLNAKDCMFRINRDIRFSSDKSPYKNNIGAYISQGGKKSDKAGYYLHFEPGNCFLAGGVWMPPSDILASIREEIDYNQEEFAKLLTSKDFKKYFKTLEGEKLKTAPKGYSSDHLMIDVLKSKSFLMIYPLEDKYLNPVKASELVKIFKAMKPVNDFLNRCQQNS